MNFRLRVGAFAGRTNMNREVCVYARTHVRSQIHRFADERLPWLCWGGIFRGGMVNSVGKPSLGTERVVSSSLTSEQWGM